MTSDDMIETQIDQAIEDKHRKLIDLGWENAEGWTLETISAVRQGCLALGHKPTDVDHSPNKGWDHRVTCELCGYVYHYDSGD